MLVVNQNRLSARLSLTTSLFFGSISAGGTCEDDYIVHRQSQDGHQDLTLSPINSKDGSYLFTQNIAGTNHTGRPFDPTGRAFDPILLKQVNNTRVLNLLESKGTCTKQDAIPSNYAEKFRELEKLGSCNIKSFGTH